MLRVVVCIKQVPMVSELPWNPQTGTLKRELAEGMMNPACAHALEAALQIKSRHKAEITAVTMGPPMAEEVLHEALAVGAYSESLVKHLFGHGRAHADGDDFGLTAAFYLQRRFQCMGARRIHHAFGQFAF